MNGLQTLKGSRESFRLDSAACESLLVMLTCPTASSRGWGASSAAASLQGWGGSKNGFSRLSTAPLWAGTMLMLSSSATQKSAKTFHELLYFLGWGVCIARRRSSKLRCLRSALRSTWSNVIKYSLLLDDVHT